MPVYPLSNVRVVDLGWSWAGPVVGQLLADLGAEVIKVETRERLDLLRRSVDNVTGDPEADPFFHAVNRNKLGITLNIADPRGAALVKRLVSISDAVIENFSPRVLKKHNLDYRALRDVKPDIVMISLPSTGSYGSLSDVVTYGPSLASLSGLDSMVGYYGENVIGTQQAYADPTSGSHGAFAVLAALWYRMQTGRGQHIELAQLELLVSCIGEAVMDYTINGRLMETQGNRDAVMAPHGNYPCKGEDKWVSIAVETEDEWHNLCQAMGNPDWTRHEMFSDGHSRLRNCEQLDRHVSDWTSNLTHYEVTDILQQAGVAAAPCLDVEDRYFDPHLQERKTSIDFPHPASGNDVIPGITFKMSQTPCEVRLPAPIMGQHNDYVFHELLSISHEDIDRLISEKVIN